MGFVELNAVLGSTEYFPVHMHIPALTDFVELFTGLYSSTVPDGAGVVQYLGEETFGVVDPFRILASETQLAHPPPLD